MSEIERSKRFLEFIWESDQEFYDNYLVNLTEDELERFRRGYQVGLAMQPEASIPTDEFKSMGRH